MNSWKSIGLSACAPPLMMFIIGTGRTRRRGAAEVAVERQARRPRRRPWRRRARRRGSRWRRAGPCWACRRARSARWSTRPGRWRRSPTSASAISPLTASTALARPCRRSCVLSPSRSSTASCAPVEAPDGTAARPDRAVSSITSTSTVGLPRLSRISRPTMSDNGGHGVFPWLDAHVQDLAACWWCRDPERGAGRDDDRCRPVCAKPSSRAVSQRVGAHLVERRRSRGTWTEWTPHASVRRRAVAMLRGHAQDRRGRPLARGAQAASSPSSCR